MWPFHEFDARQIRSQQPYWLLRNGLADAASPLRNSAECDVVIVGAGITGALVANELVDRYRLIIVDHRDAALGSTSASTALLQYEIDTDLVNLRNQVGVDGAVLAYQAGVQSIALLEALARDLPVDVNFRRCDSLYLASHRSHLAKMKKEYAARAAAGLEVEWLTDDEVLERFGCRRSGAILSRAAAEMDPYRMTRALLARCVAKQAQLYGLTRVTGFSSASGKIQLGTSSGIAIKANHAIICCGYESLRFLPKKVADLHSTYAFVTEPTQLQGHAVESAVLWESARPYTYLRATPDQRLLMGGEDLPFSNPSARDANLEHAVRKLRKRYASLFDAELPPIDYSWAGTFAETADGLPYIGHAQGTPPELLFALCFGGNGITFSAHAGAILKASIENRPHPLQEIFGFGRLQ